MVHRFNPLLLITYNSKYFNPIFIYVSFQIVLCPHMLEVSILRVRNIRTVDNDKICLFPEYLK